MKPDKVEEFFSRLARLTPEPKGELNYTNPYTLLVAVTLSAQATDVGVNKATKELFKIVKTPKDMLKLGEAGLKEHIKTVGLFNTKAKNVIKAAEILVRDFKGRVPENHEDLMKLPGVGRKTANVVLNIAFGHETIAVDTHIFRVGNRTGLARGKNPDEVENRLLKIVPEKYLRHAHHWLILHGRYTCKARAPMCFNCPVVDLCAYKDKNL